ncbi:hypothetical protein TNCV_150921 [Trichonephila clavipes]|nr:hypothetical protein TNCV_150921 [Trichonephila clavipes]
MIPVTTTPIKEENGMDDLRVVYVKVKGEQEIVNAVMEHRSDARVWCQRWGFMPITRPMDEQLKALLEALNAMKNSKETAKNELKEKMVKGQEETKERMEKG